MPMPMPMPMQSFPPSSTVLVALYEAGIQFGGCRHSAGHQHGCGHMHYFHAPLPVPDLTPPPTLFPVAAVLYRCYARPPHALCHPLHCACTALSRTSTARTLPCQCPTALTPAAHCQINPRSHICSDSSHVTPRAVTQVHCVTTAHTGTTAVGPFPWTLFISVHGYWVLSTTTYMRPPFCTRASFTAWRSPDQPPTTARSTRPRAHMLQPTDSGSDAEIPSIGTFLAVHDAHARNKAHAEQLQCVKHATLQQQVQHSADDNSDNGLDVIDDSMHAVAYTEAAAHASRKSTRPQTGAHASCASRTSPWAHYPLRVTMPWDPARILHVGST
ncbi:hypothetical protein BC834DRAFT_847195 [Gloeopeniophorella convolvens]|nr:hypothetical protein BC834DRAFT_847195 [Gloeopeniophorella convolvens]